MEEYLEKGKWFGVVGFIISMIACLAHAIQEYGFFLGVFLGFIVGGFISALVSVICAFLWPLWAFCILGIIYLVIAEYQN